MHYQWYCKFNNWISREAFENSISEFFIHSHKITSYQLSTPIINWQQANCTCTCSMHIFKRIFLSLWLNLAKCSLASRILVHTVHVARTPSVFTALSTQRNEISWVDGKSVSLLRLLSMVETGWQNCENRLLSSRSKLRRILGIFVRKLDNRGLRHQRLLAGGINCS